MSIRLQRKGSHGPSHLIGQWLLVVSSASHEHQVYLHQYTVNLRYNEPLYNELFAVTENFAS